jgi:serine phosphatase RsbU (regulator of sigma subunit)/Tfp pilus assembly protein PilF
MKVLISICLSLIFSLSVFGQKDSLLNVIKTSDNDTTILEAYVQLGDPFFRVQSDSARYYYLKAIEIAEKIDFFVWRANLENAIGLCYMDQENYEEAIVWFKRCAKKMAELNTRQGTAMLLNNIGACYNEMQQSSVAMKYFLVAQRIEWDKAHKDVVMLLEVNMGNVYEDLGQDSLALEHYHNSLSLTDPETDPYNNALSHHNIGVVLFLNDPTSKEGLARQKRAYEIATANEFANLQTMTSTDIIRYYLEEEQLNLDSANYWITCSRKSSAIANSPTLNLGVNETISRYHLMKGQYDSCRHYIDKGMKLFPIVQEKQDKISFLFAAASSYEEIGDFQKAFNYYRDASVLRKNTYNERNSQIFANLKNNHEIEKRDQEIALSKKENDVKDAQIESDQNRIRFFLIGTVLLILLLGFIVYFLIQKNKNNKLLSEQNAVIEKQQSSLREKQNEIIDSINYAKRIQGAVLPKSPELQRALKNGFVLYLPKDIVSGDFYWMYEIDTSNYLVAVADCTGHGVPGAMVSVVCNNALNRSVNEYKLREPAAILDKTRELVVQEFEQKDEKVRDGMDISLIKINVANGDLAWAGANNPLWILRKVEGNIDLLETKADKQPIGFSEMMRPFTNHQLTLKPNDRLFLFSDGFVDQFGGEKGKKYKRNRFKSFLINHYASDMDTLKEEMKGEFLAWKGDFDQLDDICVIGIDFQ